MAWATNEVAHLTGRRQFGDGGTIEKNCMSTVYKKSCTSLSGSCTSTASQLHKTGTKLHKKSLSKHIHAGSSFEEHIARISVVKADLNFDIWFKSYGFFKKQKLKSKLSCQLSLCTRDHVLFFSTGHSKALPENK